MSSTCDRGPGCQARQEVGVGDKTGLCSTVTVVGAVPAVPVDPERIVFHPPHRAPRGSFPSRTSTRSPVALRSADRTRNRSIDTASHSLCVLGGGDPHCLAVDRSPNGSAPGGTPGRVGGGVAHGMGTCRTAPAPLGRPLGPPDPRKRCLGPTPISCTSGFRPRPRGTFPSTGPTDGRARRRGSCWRRPLTATGSRRHSTTRRSVPRSGAAGPVRSRWARSEPGSSRQGARCRPPSPCGSRASEVGPRSVPRRLPHSS